MYVARRLINPKGAPIWGPLIGKRAPVPKRRQKGKLLYPLKGFVIGHISPKGFGVKRIRPREFGITALKPESSGSNALNSEPSAACSQRAAACNGDCEYQQERNRQAVLMVEPLLGRKLTVEYYIT